MSNGNSIFKQALSSFFPVIPCALAPVRLRMHKGNAGSRCRSNSLAASGTVP